MTAAGIPSGDGLVSKSDGEVSDPLNDRAADLTAAVIRLITGPKKGCKMGEEKKIP